jgi:hypothetical protein
MSAKIENGDARIRWLQESVQGEWKGVQGLEVGSPSLEAGSEVADGALQERQQSQLSTQ